MKIYADSDALPKPVREVLFRVAGREHLEAFFVAAHALRVPDSPYLTAICAGKAFNGADDWIAEHIEAGDLAVTADIPLADRCLSKGAEVLNTKGEFFTIANIKNALAMRELLDELRVSGEITGGPAPYSDRQRVLFINALDRFIQKRKNDL